MSARAHELPETVWSRCHVVTFTALAEPFVVEQLVGEGVPEVRARLAARLTGGNLGRARRLASGDDGLAFREAAQRAVDAAALGPAGALDAAALVLEAAAGYKKGLKAELDEELAPFLDDRGRPEEAYRGAIRRIETRFHRRERRAERDYVDWVLLGVASLLRDRLVAGVGGGTGLLLNPDVVPDGSLPPRSAAEGLAAVEEARAELAEEFNLNVRLVLERAFLRLAVAAPAA
jgi:DNA polymerase-3 subunit delta'